METSILKDIVIIFALATLVNLVFTKLKIPTIIGYMLTGILVGPHLLAIIHQPHDIEIMAEIGVILLMFTIGLEFSLHHLFRIRKIVFIGGFIQLFLTAGVTMVLGRFYDLNWNSAIFIGFITALSSTAIVLKLLQERSELSSNYGRTVLGILIFQDLIVVPMLLFTPFLAGEHPAIGSQLIILSIKAVIIIGIVYAGNHWLMPKLLYRVALTKNPELFLMFILLICLAFALLTYQMGMSLAIGAFLAGLMISETEYSHNAFGHIIPFKDTFTSFFFVSIGMMLDGGFIRENPGMVILTVCMVIMAKVFIAGGTGFILGHTFKGTVLVGIALGQVGEFSFIVAKVGLNYEVITPYFYQLFLATAIITMSLSPFLFRVARPLADQLLKLPIPKNLREGLFPLPQVELPDLKNHVVFIGKDSRSHNMAIMASHNKIPYIAIVFDPAMVQDRLKKHEPVLYGDAVNEPILRKAHIDTAEVAVVSVGDLITAMAIIEKIRLISKHIHIIVRTKHVTDVEDLYKLGANEVIPEEFETGIDIFERILIKLLVPRNLIDVTISGIRDDNYGIFRERVKKRKSQVYRELPNFEISAVAVPELSSAMGHTIDYLKLKKNYEVITVALRRNNLLIEHPRKETILQKGDILYLIGKPEKIAEVIGFLSL
ncbi:MAG TPA: cation:proton antiporter [Bacteroidales bacterium]|nr:cation:proton antiporter [Bacteroidales bacterium]